MSTIDAPITPKGDNAVNSPHAALIADAGQAPGQKPTANNDAGHEMVKAGTLPPLSIDGHGSQGGGAWAVAKDLGEGAWNQITEHPGQVLENAAIGAAVGIGATALVAATAPEVGVGLAVAGIGYAGYQLFEHVGSWLHDATVVDNQKDYSANEVAQAHQGLQDVGAGAVDVAAGVGGAVAGSYATGAIVGAFKGAPSVNDGAPDTSQPPADGPAQPAEVKPAPAAAAQPADAQPVQPAAAQPADAQPAQPAAGQPSDAQPAPAQPNDAQPAAAMTPEEQALANSIKSNQGLFANAGADNPVIAATKQDYNVSFTKVTEPTQVQTLESLKTGVPQAAQPGEWIATRLNPDGTPNMENGIPNSWPVTDKTILKTYQATPETLQNNAFVAATRTDAPPVHMVQLTEPTTIMTKWGPMSGDTGSYLANYDYDTATGTPGDNYAIVTKASFDATYQKVPG